jgi:4-aminobutyrate aminotransferase
MATQVKLPRIVTPLPGPRGAAIIVSDQQYVSPSYTRPYPLVVADGYGCIVEDVDGNSFLDFNAGIAVCSTGHCHPDIVRAIQQQAARLIHMSGTDFYYEHMPVLARKLESLIPGGGNWRCFFGNSGAEAMEAAIKLARYATRRHQLIAFYDSFHGRTMGALSLTASRPVQRKRFGPLIPGITHIPYPDPYRCPLNTTPNTVGDAVLNYLENVIFKTTVEPREVAAIVVEPIQGEGGYLVPPPDFLAGLERIARKYEILIVCDEVQSGMGRTGKMFGFEHFPDFHPDIIAIAKGIASGMPLGIMMARTELMTWEPGAHASTFGGNPVSLAAALETVRLLESGYMANAEKMGALLKPMLEQLKNVHDVVGDVRGLGLMLGVDIVTDRESKGKNLDLRNAIVFECFKRGLLLIGAGASTIRMCPPLVVDEEQVNVAVRLLSESISAATA